MQISTPRTPHHRHLHPAPLTWSLNTRSVVCIGSVAGGFAAIGCEVQRFLTVAPHVAPSVALKIKRNQCVTVKVQRCNAFYGKQPRVRARAHAYARAHARTHEAFYQFTVAPLHFAYKHLILLKFLVQRLVQRFFTALQLAPKPLKMLCYLVQRFFYRGFIA